MSDILLLVGLILYVVNYSVGLILFFDKFKVAEPVHKVLFTTLIISLVFVMILSELSTLSMFLTGVSMLCMLLLPLGSKGGLYHIILSTLGIIIFAVVVFTS